MKGKLRTFLFFKQNKKLFYKDYSAKGMSKQQIEHLTCGWKASSA